MDTPPPLPAPPPLPLPRPRAQKNGTSPALIIVLVVFGGVFLIALLAAMAIPAFNRVRQQARAEVARQKAALPVVPLTLAEEKAATDFGKILIKAVGENKGAAVTAMHDYNFFVERVLNGTNFPAGFRAGLLKGVSNANGGLLKEMMGKKCLLKRVTQRDGLTALTLRISFEGGGVSFLDVLITPGAPSFRIVDIYNYTFGNLASGESRQAIALMTKDNQGLLSNLLGSNAIDSTKADAVMALFTSFRERRFEDVVKGYEQLSPDLKKARTPFLIYVQSLQMLEEPTPKQKEDFIRALETAPSVLGKDTSVALLRIDPLFEKSDFKGAIACAREVIKVVGEDAYMSRLIVTAAIKDRDATTALSSLAEAEKLEPDNTGMMDLRLQVRSLCKDFAGVVRELERFTKETKSRILPEHLTEDVFTEFLASPEGRAWAGSLKK